MSETGNGGDERAQVDLRELYPDIGRAVAGTAWLERSLVGLRVMLEHGDEAVWKKAEKAQVKDNLEACLKKVAARPRPQSKSTDALAEFLTHLQPLFETRNHLVHGLPDSDSKPGTVIWRKHERKAGDLWEYSEMDGAACGRSPIGSCCLLVP